jgi:L-ascorbate metabolism protein UlaG (beta-lactamase superfamily)
MARDPLKMLLVGGPTLLIEWAGLRLLTDPTFDPAGSSYPLGPVALTKTAGPAVGREKIGPIDLVLLSHDEHADNLDSAGRDFLPRAGQVVTTVSGASRLGGNAIGLEPWAGTSFDSPTGERVTVTAAPARHGPEGCEPVCGDVIGFVLQREGNPEDVIYVSGDTVWYEGVAEVARRFRVTTAVLFLGAATVPAIGPDHLTMNATDAVQAARAFEHATIVPAHHEGWEHFSEGREVLAHALDAASVGSRVRWLEAGRLETVE